MAARILALVAASLVVAGCTGSSGGPAPAPSTPSTAQPSPTPAAPTASPTPAASLSEDPTPTADAVVRPVGDSQWADMVATGVWRRGCPVGRAGLRRVEVNYRDFDGAVRRGVLVVNADVAQSVARIFTELFDRGFPIHRIHPMEHYAGDDDAAMLDDATSAFNCRRPAQANAPAALSPHANGRAIDVNPFENPWVDPRCHCWNPDATFAAKPRRGQGVITKGGVAWTAFTDEGWIWQDIKTPDFMHFDTGYPSAPLR